MGVRVRVREGMVKFLNKQTLLQYPIRCGKAYCMRSGLSNEDYEAVDTVTVPRCVSRATSSNISAVRYSTVRYGRMLDGKTRCVGTAITVQAQYSSEKEIE